MLSLTLMILWPTIFLLNDQGLNKSSLSYLSQTTSYVPFFLHYKYQNYHHIFHFLMHKVFLWKKIELHFSFESTPGLKDFLWYLKIWYYIPPHLYIFSAHHFSLRSFYEMTLVILSIIHAALLQDDRGLLAMYLLKPLVFWAALIYN